MIFIFKTGEMMITILFLFIYILPITLITILTLKIRKIVKTNNNKEDNSKLFKDLFISFLIYFTIILLISGPISICTASCPPQWFLTYRTWFFLSLAGFNLFIPFMLARY